MLARWRPCSTTSGELSRRCCVNKKENAKRVANYLQTMGIIWRVLSRPKAMIMTQIACLDANGGHRWDGHWHTDCPARASRDSDSQREGKSASRCPPCGGGGGSGASARVAPEGALGDARLLAHTGHKAVCASGR